jgi:Uma2 family endonuclease
MSTVAVTKHRLTPEEYQVIEQAARHKSEYYNGEMFAMAGTSPAHSRISLNVGGELRARLRGSQCKPYESGLHIHVPATQLYAYPDASVVCGPLQYLAGSKTIIVNPSLIVEVLSPSTERYDRAEKFFHYQSIKTFRDYVLISQDAPIVEHFSRRTDVEEPSQWLYTASLGLNAILRLPLLNIEIPLREIYEDVEFDTSSDEMADDGFPHPGPPTT